MKKLLIVLTIITTAFFFHDLTGNEKIMIPKESIRFRVIANSDSIEDQNLKKKVKKEIEYSILNLTKDEKNINEVRNTIKSNLPLFESIIRNTVDNNNYTISYGNQYFPSKNYRGITYQEGNYESLIIKIGKGEGQNFWCVLFPPLCLLDEQNKVKDVEYHFLIKDLLKKYF